MANEKSIYLESTETPVARTCAEMLELLGRTIEAQEVSQRLHQGKVTSLRFTIVAPARTMEFELRPKPAGIIEQHRLMRAGGRGAYKPMPEAKAERIAWRQLGEWLKVEIALIEAGQRDPVTAFLPYMLGEGGITMAEDFIKTQLMLPAGKPKRKPR